MTQGFPSPSCSTFFDFELFFVRAFLGVAAVAEAEGDAELSFVFFFLGFVSSSESLRVIISTRFDFVFGEAEAAAAGDGAGRTSLSVSALTTLAEVEATGDEVDAFVGEAMLANMDWMLPFFSKSGCDVVVLSQPLSRASRERETNLDELGRVVSNRADFGRDTVAVELAGVRTEECFD